MVSAIGLGVGGTGVAAAAAASGNKDNVSMRIMVEPSNASGNTFTDTFMVTNVGNDGATNVRIDVPFDSSAVQLLGVQFNQPNAWVTSATSNEFHAALGGIDSHGQSVQVIATFAKLAGYTPSSTLPVAIAFHYSDNGASHGGTINTQLLPMEAVVQPASTSEIVSAGGTLPVNSAIFSPSEAVTFWYNTQDGQALPLYIRDGQITLEKQHKQRLSNGTSDEQGNGVTINADAQGAITAMFTTKGLAPGAYTLVAHGLSSSATAVVPFQIQ
jgi:hypothetical protein